MKKKTFLDTALARRSTMQKVYHIVDSKCNISQFEKNYRNMEKKEENMVERAYKKTCKRVSLTYCVYLTINIQCFVLLIKWGKDVSESG